MRFLRKRGIAYRRWGRRPNGEERRGRFSTEGTENTERDRKRVNMGQKKRKRVEKRKEKGGLFASTGEDLA
jgi:hypothetical protein